MGLRNGTILLELFDIIQQSFISTCLIISIIIIASVSKMGYFALFGLWLHWHLDLAPQLHGIIMNVVLL